MIKLFGILLLISTIAIGGSSAGIAIYNTNTSIAVGLVTYDAAFPTISDQVYLNGNTTSYLTAYNYNTSIMFIISRGVFSQQFAFINCSNSNTTKWTTNWSNSYAYYFQFQGLSSDQSKKGYVYGVLYKPADPNIYLVQLLTQISIANYKFVGRSRGQVFIPSTQTYFVAFTNQTGLFMKSFNSNLDYLSETQIQFLYNPFPLLDTQLNLTWDSNSNAIIATVQMVDNGEIVCGLAFYDYDSGIFKVTEMYGYTNDVFTASSPVINNYVYTFAVDNLGRYLLYKWNVLTATFQSYKSFPYNVISAY